MLQGQEKIQGPMYFKRGESLKKRTAAGAKAPHKGADFDAIMVTEGILPQEKGF
ncbi:unknown [Acidaminococcus intestini CAG:325]|nr:unknown [Acidaminococcus intestini CAG:325]